MKLPSFGTNGCAPESTASHANHAAVPPIQMQRCLYSTPALERTPGPGDTALANWVATSPTGDRTLPTCQSPIHRAFPWHEAPARTSNARGRRAGNRSNLGCGPYLPSQTSQRWVRAAVLNMIALYRQWFSADIGGCP